ncbi:MULTISPECIES: restriction endonuclease subunit S [unclassified Kitasatospora]|uniref:restriction endonuclease subunit S n=1 Tax=unclassified Kitasatospora TaxID=2633591 RepID=UPI00380A5C8A
MSTARADRWLSLTISDIAAFRSGALISVARLSARSGSQSVPVYGGNGVAGYTSSAMIDHPTVILGRVGQKCGAVYRNDGPAWVTDNALYAHQFKRPLDVHFLSLALEAARLNDVKNRNDLPLITQSILNDVKIAWPGSLVEQRQISGAMADVDDLIAALEQMIIKKQRIKQSLMQELLTGRRRLQGFGDSWECRRVAEMGDVLAGKALNVSGTGASRPYLRTKNVLDGRIELEDVLWMPMTDAEFERFRVEHGDVLLNEGQSLELVGRCSIYGGEFGTPCAMQNQLLRFRAHSGTSPEFAAHLFRHCQRTGAFAAIATKTTSVAHLGSSRLSSLRLLWPASRREQAAIAEVLSDMDCEITAHEARLDKARALKQGMMRELLTGRTRLPVMESAA